MATTTTTTAEGAPPERKPFAAFLQEARKGGLHTELSDELAALVVACRETGKKGSITLKVTVDPGKDETTLSVVDQVKVDTPRPDARPTVFYDDLHGNLHRRDPRQDELPLRGMRGGKAGNDEQGAERAQTGA